MDQVTVIEIAEDGSDAKIIGTQVAGTDGVAVVVENGATQTLLSDDPLVGMEEMRRQLAESEERTRIANQSAAAHQQQTADAERRAREARTEAARVGALNDEGQYNQITAALAANESQLESLQQQKAAALESGDYTKTAAIDASMGKVTARIVSLENGKVAIEEVRKSRPPVDPNQQQQLSQAEINEQYLRTLVPKSQEWIRNHPQFFADESFRNRVLAAAQYAQNIKNLSPNEQAYYDSIETDLGMKAATHPSAAQPEPHTPAAPATPASPTSTAAAAAPRQSSVPVAAAPSRSLPDGGGNREPPRQMVLSAEERQIAHMNEPDLGPREAEVIYAKNKWALQKEGKIAY